MLYYMSVCASLIINTRVPLYRDPIWYDIAPSTTVTEAEHKSMFKLAKDHARENHMCNKPHYLNWLSLDVNAKRFRDESVGVQEYWMCL